MAGGIFPGKPFAYNVKCIVGTIVIAAGYWFLPPKNLWVLLLLLWLPYVAMAWYDYAYDCADKMQPTLFPYGRYVFLPFKPPGYQAEFATMEPEKHRAMDRLDHVTSWTLLVCAITAAVVYYVRAK